MKTSNIFIAILFCFIFSITGVTKGKSLYTVADTDGRKIWAYEIVGNSLTYQTQYISPYGSPIGLALNGDYMFLTFETKSNVEVVSAKTMTSVQLINAPGSSNLAGIVADHDKEKVYVVDRAKTSLFVYNWDPRVPELTLEVEEELKDLQGDEKTWGLALDEVNDRLYVTLENNVVKCYDTDDWSRLPDYDVLVSHDAVGIAIDVPNQFLYTGSHSDKSLLSKVEIDPNSETTIDVTQISGGDASDHVLGIAVDQDTSLVYVTIGNIQSGGSERVVIFDSNLNYKESTDDIGDPAGIAVDEVTYKEPVLSITKDDDSVECVSPLISKIEHDQTGTPYNWLYYNINYDMDGYADTNVKITDYLPMEVDEPNFISDNGEYNSDEHMVTWSLGNLNGTDSGTVRIQLGVNDYAKPGHTIRNFCEIEGDTYSSLYSVINTNICCYGGEIIYVDKDADGYNNGTSWINAYIDLQDGFTTAENCSDTTTALWVAAGTYKPTQDIGETTATFDLVEGVGLFGHFGGIGTNETSTSQRNFADTDNETILTGTIGGGDGEQVNRVIYGQNIDSAIVDGFTITGSSQDGIYFDNCDGSVVNCKLVNNDRYGIWCYNYSYPDIHNCSFANNQTTSLYITSNCWPEISYCTFDGNDTAPDGVYIANSVVIVENSVFEDHTDNGILGSNSTLTVANCDFRGDNDDAIHLTDVTTTVTNCSISNCGDDGIYASDSDLTINHTLISDSYDNALYTTSGCDLTLKNSVIRYSGESGLELNSNYATTIKNNWIHDNGTDQSTSSGGAGIWFTNQVSVPLICNNTIYNNFTYGIESSENGADPEITNCIIRGNGTSDLYRVNGTFNSVNYSCLQNTHSGNGNITSDPCFYDVNNDNLHLISASDCKNTGDPCYSPETGETDIDMEDRIKYSRVDMGADEYYWSLADFNNDEIIDYLDFTIFEDTWLLDSIDPCYNDDCDLVDDDVIDVDDLVAVADEWLWQAGWAKTGVWSMSFGGAMEMMTMGAESSLIQGPELMLLDNEEILNTMPDRLSTKSQKFYIDASPLSVNYQPTIEEQIEQYEYLIDWLETLWKTDKDLKKEVDKDAFDGMIDSLQAWLNELEGL